MMPAQKPGKSRQDYGTPTSLIESVTRRFGPLVWDLAASETNKKAPGFYGLPDNSLECSWAIEHPAGNLWLNPPFYNIAPWAEKCAAESKLRQGLILFLTPASVGANWFLEHVHNKAYVLALNPRLTFEGEKDPYPKDCILSVYGLGFSGFDAWRWNER